MILERLFVDSLLEANNKRVLCSSELIAKINDEPWKLSSDDET